MNLFVQGILWGLTLSILVGPILFALIQTGLERGFRAGMMVGLGIWISDLLFILSVYWGLTYIIHIAEWPGFTLWLGILGGIILILLGIGFLVIQPLEVRLREQSKRKKAATYLALFTKGFLINTLNPFTFFFWVSISGAMFVKDPLSTDNALLFYSGILLTIILTDTFKVVMAKLVGRYLKPHYILFTRRVVGIVLILFGVGLMIRVLAYSYSS